jgi:hypothetical protein
LEFKQARTRTYSLISALLVSTAMVVPATSGALAANVQTEIAQATYSFDISVSSLAEGLLKSAPLRDGGLPIRLICRLSMVRAQSAGI